MPLQAHSPSRCADGSAANLVLQDDQVNREMREGVVVASAPEGTHTNQVEPRKIPRPRRECQ